MAELQTTGKITNIAGGDIVFQERTKVNRIGFLIQGKISMESLGTKQLLGPGSFIGIQDVYSEYYLCTYKAVENSVVTFFNVKNPEHLCETIVSNPDYCSLSIISLCKQLSTLFTQYNSLKSEAKSIYYDVDHYKSSYEQQSNDILLEKDTIDMADNLKPFEDIFLNEKVLFYNEISNFSIDSVRNFYSQGNLIIKCQMHEISNLYYELYNINSSLVSYISNMLNYFAGNTPDSIFYKYVTLSTTASERQKPVDEINKNISNIIGSIRQHLIFFQVNTSKKPGIQMQTLEYQYQRILSGSTDKITFEQSNPTLSDEELLSNTIGSLDAILNYGNIPPEQAAEFKKLIQTFSQLPDFYSTEDNVRALRRSISNKFYPIYERVFFKAYTDRNQPAYIELFLKYGFVDETLITKEQLIALYHLSRSNEAGKFKVYNAYSWLCSIYKGEHEPSKNEFDLDYTEFLRSEVIANHINQEEYNQKINDQVLKVSFEIENFLRYTTSIASGKFTTFVPLLFQANLPENLDRFTVSAHKIEAALQEILDIDFSLFYREISYTNPEKKISLEYIMAEVLPEFILVPIVGSNGIMWQTISGKAKDTPGRFVLPIFTDGNLNDMILKLCARFRWEMCRTDQGVHWNDIKYKSLTSEYMDYIQFYKKNRDLSEEKKDKIKAQIQKCNRRTADVFSLDYEAWIKAESTGSVRLNKVSREILAMYCPFNKSIRTKLNAQPLFANALRKYEIIRTRRVKELSIRYKSMQNNGIEITKELKTTLDLYQKC